MQNTANYKTPVDSGAEGRRYTAKNGSAPNSGVNSSHTCARSPWVVILPDELVRTIDHRGQWLELAYGRSLRKWDRVQLDERHYGIVKGCADHGAVGKEIAYAPVQW